MIFRRCKPFLIAFPLCLLCIVYVLASEHGQSTYFGKNVQDICSGNECTLDSSDAVVSDTNTAATSDVPVHVLITFTNAEHKPELQAKFAVTVSSLFQYSTRPVMLYVIGDPASQLLAKNILAERVSYADKYKLFSLGVDDVAKKLDFLIQPLQKHFSYKPGAYYSHALFFTSVGMHRIMPESIDRAIMLDADLKFRGDIAQLYKHFDAFAEENVVGIAHEAQPVYRHTFWQFRHDNPSTRVGEPPPYGLPGFNSGVLLLDLNRMRQSTLYNTLLDANTISQLSADFHFKGHLGDQDFFTLVGMRYEQLFYVLPCQWNRQLCRWWEENGYKDVFHLYHNCDANVMIYHGNCNTPIP